MDYYIEPEQVETDYLRITTPEEIKICDPACGSGHILVYAFDLLYAIYEEEGYDPAGIAEKILTHNLFGIEIDERAGGSGCLCPHYESPRQAASLFRQARAAQYLRAAKHPVRRKRVARLHGFHRI